MEPTTRKSNTEHTIFSFVRNLFVKYRKRLLDGATKTEVDAQKLPFKKVVHKSDE